MLLFILEYLPAYLADLNQIEKYWAKAVRIVQLRFQETLIKQIKH
jgi:hypothetical protein